MASCGIKRGRGWEEEMAKAIERDKERESNKIVADKIRSDAAADSKRRGAGGNWPHPWANPNHPEHYKWPRSDKEINRTVDEDLLPPGHRSNNGSYLTQAEQLERVKNGQDEANYKKYHGQEDTINSHFKEGFRPKGDMNPHSDDYKTVDPKLISRKNMEKSFDQAIVKFNKKTYQDVQRRIAEANAELQRIENEASKRNKDPSYQIIKSKIKSLYELLDSEEDNPIQDPKYRKLWDSSMREVRRLESDLKKMGGRVYGLTAMRNRRIRTANAISHKLH